MEHTLIGAYVVLLLGYLIMDNKVINLKIWYYKNSIIKENNIILIIGLWIAGTQQTSR